MANAGIKDGDILSAIDGYDIDAFGQCTVPWLEERTPLDAVLGLMTESSKPKIDYIRNGELKTVTLSLSDPKKPGCPIMSKVNSSFENVSSFAFNFAHMCFFLNQQKKKKKKKKKTIL